MNIEQLDEEGRWWRVGPFEVDTRADQDTHPGNVRACVLAHRDATDDEGRDIAAILLADVEAGEYRPLPITSAWLFKQSQIIYVRLMARIEKLEKESREHTTRSGR